MTISPACSASRPFATGTGHRAGRPISPTWRAEPLMCTAALQNIIGAACGSAFWFSTTTLVNGPASPLAAR